MAIIKVSLGKDANTKPEEKHIFTHEQVLGLFENMLYWHNVHGEIDDGTWNILANADEEDYQFFCEKAIEMGYPKSIGLEIKEK
jgi:hypothetical protein